MFKKRNMQFSILLAFLCIFSAAVTANGEGVTATLQPEELATVKTELNDSSLEQHEVDDKSSVEANVETDGPYSEDRTIITVSSEETSVKSNESSEEIDSNVQDSAENIDIKTSESSEEDDTKTTVTSEEIDSNNGGSAEKNDSKSKESSEEIDPEIKEPSKEANTTARDPSELVKTTSAPTGVSDGSVFPNKKVLGMNIGLYFILEEIQRKLAFSGRVPRDLVIKVLVMSSKIEEMGGEVIPLNRNMMKIIPNILPSSFRNAVCSSSTPSENGSNR